MKKAWSLLVTALIFAAVCMLAVGCAKGEAKKAWMFDTPDETISYEMTGVTQWSPEITINLKVVGGNNKVLFAGKVKVKSVDRMCSNFIYAVAVTKGWANTGIETGFIETLEDYTNNSETNTYWLYKLNGKDPSFGCNQEQMREGDYVLLNYVKSE